MPLSTEDRNKVRRGLARYWSRSFETLGDFDKADLLAAIVATDEWIDDNQASFNTALPVAFRGNATLSQKTLVFCLVASARVSIALARRLVGGMG